jgi:hypothetical protein
MPYLQWAQQNAVEFDAPKTDAVLFSRRRGAFPQNVIDVNGKEITFNKKATKWLGIWLDSHLTL